jgi:hypothetical protein
VRTKSALTVLFNCYAPWETFQSDGGSHFDNVEVCGIRREDTCGGEVLAMGEWVGRGDKQDLARDIEEAVHAGSGGRRVEKDWEMGAFTCELARSF